VTNNDSGIPWFKMTGDAKIETIGRIAANYKHPNRKLSYWVLGLVHSGERTVKIDEHPGRAGAGEYFLLPPNLPHGGIHADDHDVSFVHFEMEGDQIETPRLIDSDVIVLPVFGMVPKEIDVMRSFQYLHHQYSSGQAGNRFLNIQLQAILHQLSCCMQKRQILNNRNDKLVDELFQFILTNLTSDLSSEVFEDKFALSYRQLNIIFKGQFRTTIKKKIIELRVEQAFNLLLSGESIAGAAEKSGFKDYFYFLKCFKKIKSFTPKEMKQNDFR
jgi:AraC-like DNA-binding protein